MGSKVLAFAAFGLILGCSPSIRLRQIDDSMWFEREGVTALGGKTFSERTRQFLRREGLLEGIYRDTEAVLLDLHAKLVERRDRDIALHLAELCHLEARHRGDEEEAQRYYLSSVQYAYAYLFDPELGVPPSGYDPGFRWACDFYNRSLGRVIRYAHERRLGQAGTFALPTLSGQITTTMASPDFNGWDPSEFTEVLVAFYYDVVGLPGLSRSHGLGVPLILVKEGVGTDVAIRPKILEKMTAMELPEFQATQSYAATAILRIEGSVVDGGPQTASFEAYDPAAVSTVEVAGNPVPLEADLTSPLVYTLDQMPSYSGLSALFNVDEAIESVGLMMLQPYDAKKIPVVFVHGLLSSPVTWMPLFNDLLADPVLRQRFQFWFFRYPTGNPILVSAALLRDTLLEIRRIHDPDGENPAFQDAVIVGHSMGGLLTKMQLLDGGDRLWNALSEEPLESLELPEEQESLVRHAIYFERLPFLTRAVFMATPHRGAEMATSWIGRLGARLIDLPTKVLNTTRQLAEKVGRPLFDRLGIEAGDGSFTGVAGLDPRSFMSSELSTWALPEDVPIHSVIGNEEEADTRGGGDGLVAYESSHLDGVQSEVVVHSGHNVHEHPLALRELRRILHLHLSEHDAALSAPRE